MKASRKTIPQDLQYDTSFTVSFRISIMEGRTNYSLTRCIYVYDDGTSKIRPRYTLKAVSKGPCRIDEIGIKVPIRRYGKT